MTILAAAAKTDAASGLLPLVFLLGLGYVVVSLFSRRIGGRGAVATRPVSVPGYCSRRFSSESWSPPSSSADRSRKRGHATGGSGLLEEMP
jgi:hypothetical protein